MEGRNRGKRHTRKRTRENGGKTGTDKKGYMNSHGRPRQPRKTQENKAGTLRYEQETETWHCAKCAKQYSKQNARSAKSHAVEHMKKEAKITAAQEQALRRREAKQSQDEARLRTLQKYGLEYRGKYMEKQQHAQKTKTNKRKRHRTGGKTSKEKKTHQMEHHQGQKQHLKPQILKKMRQSRKENAWKTSENTTNKTVKTSNQLSKEKRSEATKSRNATRKTTKLKN